MSIRSCMAFVVAVLLSAAYGGRTPSAGPSLPSHQRWPCPAASSSRAGSTARPRGGGQDSDSSRVHCDSLDEAGARLDPCGITTATPQHTSPLSPGQSLNSSPGVPPPSGRVRTAPGPCPPGLGPVRALRNVNAGSLRIPFHPARRTRAIRQSWHVPAWPGPLATLPVVTLARLPPAPPPCCDRAGGEGLSPPLEYTAPHGALNGTHE
jgi:hypothetical protein